MKKVLLALPLVAGASWAGSTYYSGTQAQPAYEKFVSELNAATVESFVLDVAEYDAGFTTSTAVTNVRLYGEPDAVLFQLKHDIQHSPIGSDSQGARFSASSITTTLVKDKIESNEVLQIIASFDSGEPFVLYTDVEFTGDLVSDLQLHSLDWRSDDDGAISFEGGRFKATSAGGKIDISGVLGAIDVSDDAGNVLTVAESTSKFDLLQVANGVFTGDQSIVFPSVEFKGEMGIEFSLIDAVLDSVAALDGDKVNTSMGLSVAKISSPLPLNSVDWEIDVNGLSVKGLENYVTAVNDIVNTTDTGDISAQLKEAYTGLITPGVDVINKLILTNDGGDIVGDINLSFLGDGTASGMDSIATVGDLLESMKFSVTLDADQPAIELTPAAMFMMHPMAQQYIVNEGDKYTADIHIANLMLDVNGNIQPLSQLIGDQLNTPLDFLSAMADY